MNKSTKRGYSIRIFLPEGIANGLKVVEKSNWSGRGVVCPRALFAEGKGREEFERTGVYILIGSSDSGVIPMIYIGQGDPVRPRLESHYAKKEFWTTAIFFVSKDENLNKAHIAYLESRLISMAKEAKRATLDNVNTPVLPSMSEMDIADAEGFLDEMLLCLPVLGVSMFTKPAATTRKGELKLKGKDASATGFEAPDGFVVKAGGKARKEETPAVDKYISNLRTSLLDRGILAVEGNQYALTQDYTFSSPSQAAATMLGRNANGRTEWKDSRGKTLKSIQDAGASE